MTRRRWIADEWTDTSAALLDTQAAHLGRTLRAQVGQEFDIVVGNTVRRGVVKKVLKDIVEFSLHEEIAGTEPLPLVLAIGIVRFERLEWAIEKLTELGVARILPVIAERSEKHLAQAAAKRVERWRRIARESAQQSRSADIPEIATPQPLFRWLEEIPDGLRLLLSERERAQSLRRRLEASFSTQLASQIMHAAIGPEGGWTDAELTGFAGHGWQSISLGPRILRTETAAIAIASIVSAWLDPPRSTPST